MSYFVNYLIHIKNNNEKREIEVVEISGSYMTIYDCDNNSSLILWCSPFITNVVYLKHEIEIILKIQEGSD